MDVMKKMLRAIVWLLAVGLVYVLIMISRSEQGAAPRVGPDGAGPGGAGPDGAGPDGTEVDPKFAAVFEVRIERPRAARPLFGILPDSIEEEMMDGVESFDQTSPGAELDVAELNVAELDLAGPGFAGPGRFEASANGWQLVLQVGGQGRLAAGSQLVFPFAVGGRQVSLRCHPARPPIGFLRAVRSPDSRQIEGSFRIELSDCENAASGRPVDWPPSPPFGLSRAPLTVAGRFVAPSQMVHGTVSDHSDVSPASKPSAKRASTKRLAKMSKDWSGTAAE